MAPVAEAVGVGEAPAYGMPRWALLAGGALLTTIAVVGLVATLVGHFTGDPPAGGGLLVW